MKCALLMRRVGQNRTGTPRVTVCIKIPLLDILHIYRLHMHVCMYGSDKPCAIRRSNIRKLSSGQP